MKQEKVECVISKISKQNHINPYQTLTSSTPTHSFILNAPLHIILQHHRALSKKSKTRNNPFTHAHYTPVTQENASTGHCIPRDSRVTGIHTRVAVVAHSVIQTHTHTHIHRGFRGSSHAQADNNRTCRAAVACMRRTCDRREKRERYTTSLWQGV